MLGVDRIAVGTGQTSGTMISALESPRGPDLLQIMEGRNERDLKRVWRWWGTRRAPRITHAVMGRGTPFRNRFKAHCPGVPLLYDTFPVIRPLVTMLNAVRKAKFQQAAGHFRGLPAGTTFLLLSWQRRLSGAKRGRRSTTGWRPIARC